MRSLYLFMGLLALFLFLNIRPLNVQADEAGEPQNISAEEEQIRKDIEEWAKSAVDGDTKTFFKLAHPRAFERRIGLKEETAKQLKAWKEVRDKLDGRTGMKFSYNMEYPQPAIFIKSSVHEFAIVPCVIIVDTKLIVSKTHTFQLGVREIGEKKWRYLDGSKLDQGDIRDYFEDFPKEQPLPLVKTEIERRKDVDIGELLKLPPMPRLPM